jgi:predicted double-glycine peptidase
MEFEMNFAACYGRLSIIILMITGANASIAAEPVRSLSEIRENGVVKQQWDLSCGAAALATLLRYQHGVNISEREVATLLIRRKEYLDHPQIVQLREGFSLSDLKRAANAVGYQAQGLGRMTFDDLLRRAPVIVPIRTLGYNHFVIVRGAYAGRLLLADPAWGNRTMPIEHFMQKWIDYPQLGHVGLTLSRSDGLPALEDMSAKPSDFPFVR